MSMNYIKILEDGSTIATTDTPTFGEVSTTGDYLLNGLWYDSTGVLYTEQFTYLSKGGKLLVAEIANGIPVDIHYDELAPTLVEDTIKVSNLVVGDRVIFEDRPVFTGYAGGTNITSAGVIFDWAVELDTHNAYNNGIWTCPKAGWYKFNPRVWNTHSNTTRATVVSIMYINGVEETRFYSEGTYYQQHIGIEPTIMKYLEVGDTMYIESEAASSTHFVWFMSDKKYTNIVITYEGA